MTLTPVQLHTFDGRPVAACYMCYAILKKCRKFISTAERAENVLTGILYKQSKITEKSVALVDREAQGLCGSLGYAGSQCSSSKLLVPLVVKTEPKSEVGDIDSETSEVANDIENENEQVSSDQWEADSLGFQDMQFDDLDDTTHRLDVESDIKQNNMFEDDATARPSTAGDRKLDGGNKTNRKQRESRRESTTDVASGQTSKAVKRKRTEGSSTNTNQRKSRESTRETVQETHQCHICQRVCSRKSNLTKHYMTHINEKRFQCNVCGRCFTVESAFEQHLRSHTGEKPFQCKKCLKSFTQKGTLSRHIVIHSGERPYKCEECNMAFSQQSTLSSHMKIHTGEKPYQCYMCGRRFIQSYNLTAHLKIHTGEKPFCCDVCQKSFGQKTDLRKHMKRHFKNTNW
ncbi:zinc finger protein with KRAB and SCAN domains 8-like isoform X2 [Plodia interpunctella]|uniref:zinc finger protein with KRAB and SCAN domains 8-like isoform X2 n=1 Tax=Plodia interpunctella TaxID=58824 RepID=UPI002367D7D7|nr:zinc finger protein with KRAB and SCAN domains 8-like isoform X2 [Plodia interpunctella]